MRKEDILPFLTAWMDGEHIMPGDIGQTEEDRQSSE